jgi:hypothetical protein
MEPYWLMIRSVYGILSSNCDYYEYDGKLIDQNLLQTQIYHLQTTKKIP